MFTVAYAVNSDGHHVARLEDTSFIALPSRNGLRVANAWRSSKSLIEISESDCWGCTIVPDVAGFRAHVEELAAHRREVQQLGRRSERARHPTPWDMSDNMTIYAPGIVCYDTPSHGGFRIDADRLSTMPPLLRNADGWFEEDCEWAKVAIAFPRYFTAHERKHARKTIEQWFPEIAPHVLPLKAVTG